MPSVYYVIMLYLYYYFMLCKNYVFVYCQIIMQESRIKMFKDKNSIQLLFCRLILITI